MHACRNCTSMNTRVNRLNTRVLIECTRNKTICSRFSAREHQVRNELYRNSIINVHLLGLHGLSSLHTPILPIDYLYTLLPLFLLVAFTWEQWVVFETLLFHPPERLHMEMIAQSEQFSYSIIVGSSSLPLCLGHLILTMLVHQLTLQPIGQPTDGEFFLL